MAEDLETQVNQNTLAINKNTSILDRVSKTLYGNGEMGMDESLRNIDTKLTSIILEWTDERKVALEEKNKEIDRKNSFNDKVKLAIIGTVITNVLFLVIAIFKIYPTVVLWMQHVGP